VECRVLSCIFQPFRCFSLSFVVCLCGSMWSMSHPVILDDSVKSTTPSACTIHVFFNATLRNCQHHIGYTTRKVNHPDCLHSTCFLQRNALKLPTYTQSRNLLHYSVSKERSNITFTAT